MSFKVRRAIPSDSVELAYTKMNAWREAYPELLPKEFIEKNTNFEELYFAYQKATLQSGHAIFVVLYNNILVGMFEIRKGTAPEIEGNPCELLDMNYLPMYWNKGYGKRTYRYIKKIVKARKYDKIYLWVLSTNTRAKYFFEVCGFKPDGAVRKVKTGENTEAEEIRMVKDEL